MKRSNLLKTNPRNQKKLAANAEVMPSLSDREVHSIASNVAGKLDDKISTQKYEQEVLKELGISSLKSQPGPESRTSIRG